MVPSPKAPAVLILAAGQGKRMKSPLPKVLHRVAGEPLLFPILRKIRRALPDASVGLVVGHGRDLVQATIQEQSEFSKLGIEFIFQSEQKGTGHAARCALDSNWGKALLKNGQALIVLPGDTPLVSEDLLRKLASPLGKNSALRLLTCEFPDPTGYGRVVRKGKTVTRIAEEKDASPRERQIREVAVSIYVFHSSFLQAALSQISNRNAQGEFYLTDAISCAVKKKKHVETLKWMNPEDLLGINDPWELSQVSKILNLRGLEDWGRRGVYFLDPDSTWVDGGVLFEGNAVIHPQVILRGKTVIGNEAELGPGVVLENVQVGESAIIETGTVAERAQIGAGAQVGPYARLRPEAVVGPEAKIGNFVELKKSRIGARTKIAHLSYVGDAEIGNDVNIGCGFITCNFDGRIIEGQRKHKTWIEDDVFVGSDCQTVAPVRIRKGAYIASGSTITEDVEADSLAIARARQVNKTGYARKLLSKNL